MNVAQVLTDTASPNNPAVNDLISAAHWQARVELAACYRLVIDGQILAGAKAMFAGVTQSERGGGQLAWPALLRTPEQFSPGSAL